MCFSDGAPALGKAETLKPLAYTRQAFRFVALDQKHQRTVQLGIQSHSTQYYDEERWIAEFDRQSSMGHRHEEKPGKSSLDQLPSEYCLWSARHTLFMSCY
jgi:hypothetical protein